MIHLANHRLYAYGYGIVELYIPFQKLQKPAIKNKNRRYRGFFHGIEIGILHEFVTI